MSRLCSSCVCIALLAFTSATHSAPPSVVQTVPAHGQTGVSPELAEIRVTFDQDMQVGGYSFCGGGAKYPKVTGQPRWLDARTCVLPVALEPDHDYNLSINCAAGAGFRSAATGEVVPSTPLVFTTRTLPPVPRELQSAAVQALRKAIDERYSYRDLRGVDWDALFAERAAAMEAAPDVFAFATAAAAMLGAAQDVHIVATARAPGETGDGTVFPAFQRSVHVNFNGRIIDKVIPGAARLNDAVVTGRIAVPGGAGDIGYILFPTWDRSRADMILAARNAIRDMQNSGVAALIIDVRPNGGGDEAIARQIAGCFIHRPYVYSRSLIRNPDEPDGWSGPFDRVVEPGPAEFGFTGSVAVLIGKGCMSSNESFVLMMKSAGATLIGESTYGASGNPKPTDLGNGVTVLLPSWQDLDPAGVCIEGKGVPPDVPVETRPQDFQSSDPVLSRAIQLMRERVGASAP